MTTHNNKPTQVHLSPIEIRLMEVMQQGLDTILTKDQIRDLILRLKNNYELAANCHALAAEAWVRMREDDVKHPAMIYLVELQAMVSAYFSDPNFTKLHAEMKARVESMEKQESEQPIEQPDVPAPPVEPAAPAEGNVVHIKFGRKPNPEG